MNMKGLGKKSPGKKSLRKKILVLACILACLLTGCTACGRGRTLAEAVLTEVQAAGKTAASDTESAVDSRELLESLMELPGKKDKETAGMFGGGEENWTEDRSFYIGRIYEIEIYGEKCGVFTACGEDPDRTVQSVSVWLVNGEREISEDETVQWLERISDVMGAEPLCRYQSVESGARSWKWRKDQTAASLYRMMDDILTLSFQPAAGELS